MEGKTVERFEAIKVALAFAKTDREAFRLADRILNFVHQVNEVPEPNSKPITVAKAAKKIDPKPETRGRKRGGGMYVSHTSGEGLISGDALLEVVKMRDEGKSISKIAKYLGCPYATIYPLIRSYDDKYLHLMNRIIRLQKK
jgi:hypothetical protein